jgi:hypothetical protein
VARRDVQRCLGRAGVLGLVAPAVVVGVGLDRPADEERGAIEGLRQRSARGAKPELVADPDGRLTVLSAAGIGVGSWATSVPPRKIAGVMLGVESVRSVQCTSTPLAGAVGEPSKAKPPTPAPLPSGIRLWSAPNVTAARAPAGTSSSMHRRANANRTAMTAL